MGLNCNIATTAALDTTYTFNLTTNTYQLTFNATGAQTIDGQSLGIDMIVLVKNQVDLEENGIYICSTAPAMGVAGVLSLSPQFISPYQINNWGVIIITGGATNANSGWIVTSNVIQVGVTDIEIDQFVPTNPSGINMISGTLSSADIIAMQGTGQILVPAPPAGYANFVVGNFFNALTGTVAWTGGGNIWLIYGTTGNDQVNLASAFLTNQLSNFSASTNYVFGCGPGIGSDWLGSSTGNLNSVLSSVAINQPISITCVNPVVAGNGSIDYTIWYATVLCS